MLLKRVSDQDASYFCEQCPEDYLDLKGRWWEFQYQRLDTRMHLSHSCQGVRELNKKRIFIRLASQLETTTGETYSVLEEPFTGSDRLPGTVSVRRAWKVGGKLFRSGCKSWL